MVAVNTGLNEQQLVNRLILTARMVLLQHATDGTRTCVLCKVPLDDCRAHGEALAVLREHAALDENGDPLPVGAPLRSPAEPRPNGLPGGDA